MQPFLQSFKHLRFASFLTLLAMLTAGQNFAQTVVVNPSSPWVVPAGVTSVKVEVWGAGGGGGGSQNTFLSNRFGGGGGGGGYSVATLAVTPGQTYTSIVGTGGSVGSNANGGTGGTSTFSGPAGSVSALGGGGGVRSTAATGGAAGTGNSFNGGVGGTGTSNGAGGGGGAGNAGAGQPGTNSVGGAGGNGNPSAAPYRGGSGGGAETNATNNGNSGTAPGGGGGGGKSNTSTSSGGVGGAGQVVITYTLPTYKSQFISMNTGAAAWCPGETRNVTVTIKNTGTATWTNSNPEINLGVKWNTDVSFAPDSWADYHVRVDAGGLAPGATATYTVPLTASNHQGAGYTTPLSAGSNNITFDLVYEGLSWFGDNNNGVGPGNVKFTSLPITISAIPQGSLADNTICSGSAGQLTFNATAGTGPFTIVYNDGVANRTATNVSSGVAFNTFSNPSATTNYTLISVTSAAGCARTNSFTDGSATTTVNTAASIPVQPVSQTKCAGQSVTFSATASGSSATYQWRKNGVNITGATASSYTIAAVAAGDAASYTVVVSVNSCGSITSQPATLTVNARPTASITSNSTVTICNGGSTNITGTVTASGAWTLNLNNGGSATGTGNGPFSITVSPTVATTYTIASLNDANCTAVAGGLSGSTAVTVNPFPTSVSASPAASQICLGSAVSLTGTASLGGTSALVVENFNGASSFTVTGSSNGNRSQVWQQELSGANVNSIATFTSPGGGNLMVSTAGTGTFLGSSSVASILTSGLINTTEFTSLTTLTFNHSYKDGSSTGSGIVEVSTNGGSSWATLATYNSNQGSSTSFLPVSIPFASYVNMSNLKLRFNFSAGNTFGAEAWWAIDDIVLNGVRKPLFSWVANTAPGINGLPTGAGNPTTSNKTISVNPTVTTEYTLTATNPVTGCSASATPIVVNVSPAPTLTAPADATLTTSADGPGNCSAVYAWTHPVVNTSCPTTLSVAYTGGRPAPAALPADGTVSAGSNASQTFSTGVTIITYTAKDQNDNIATTSFTVTVTDDELPTITCAPDITVTNASGECQATINLTAPSTSDNCGIDEVTNDHPSNNFPVGKTFVTWTVTDINNNVSTCEQLVIVEDTEAPAITCAADVNVSNDPGVCEATITLSAPAATDNCGIAEVVSNHPSNVFPVGKTLVEWTVTDNSGNTANCTQLVVVTDNELPVITCPLSLTVNTDLAASYATINLQQPVVTDNCGVSGTVNDHPSAQFPIGKTLVTWTATDVSGNTITCEQTIVVNDTIQPAISFNAPIDIYNTPSNCDGLTDVTYPQASDNSGHVTVTSDYSELPTPSIDPTTPLVVDDVTFPVGTTTIVWTATDPSANTSWNTQMVTVTDNEKPTITCPADINLNNDAGLCTAETSLGTPVTADNCGVLNVSNDHPSSTYPVGTTVVTWTVTDIHNNSSTCTQNVTVTDVEIPNITSAANVSVTADNGQCAAVITLTPPATGDNCGVAGVTNNHASTTYPVGTTTVTWVVTDIHGNTNMATQTVTVTDNELPVIAPSNDITQTADAGKCGASVGIVSPAATDNCSVGATVGTRSDGLAIGADYPVGTTTITWNVTDIHGNNALSVTQKVTITDNEIPVISAGADINANNDAGECGALVTVNAATATDNCGVGATTGTRSDALALNAPYPVGTTTITWMVTDIHGNAANAVFQTITVTDNEAPVIAAAVNINVSNDSAQCGATLSIIPLTATDNCGVNPTIGIRNDGLELTDPYPVGTTTIEWTVVDIHGNAANPVTQTVTVTDNELPLITASPDITRTADAGVCGAAIAITDATATDNCGVGATTGTRSDALPLNALYPVGITTISWTVTDIHGNDATTVIQTITVSDNELPVIAAGDDVTETADAGQCGATIAIVQATATDNCGVGPTTGTRSDGLALNALYPVGTTTITWRVSDINGNAAVAITQTIIITDDELPVITASPDIAQTADAGKCSADVAITDATATDNCGVGQTKGTRSDALALNDPYPVGTTTITWAVTDVHGNVALTVNQTVTVTDDELPVISASPDISKTADAGKCSATMAITPATATDNCGVGAPSGMRSDALALTDPYPAGTTTIAWTVTDMHDNAGVYKTQVITVTDNEIPTITAAPNVSVNNDAGLCIATVILVAPATGDNCGVQNVVNDHPSTTYPKGTTTVTWTVTDIHGNTNTAIQTVTVADNEKPTFTRPADKTIFTSATCTYDAGTNITGDVIDEHDNCTTGLQASFTDVTVAGACAGSKIIKRTWHLTDADGHAAADQVQTITVSDNTAPTFTAPAAKTIYTTASCTYDASTAATGDVTNEADNCSTGLQATYSDVVSNGTCVGSKVITRTWSLVDNCGNAAATQVQVITVTDNTAPVISKCAPSVTVVPNFAGCTSKLLDYRSAVVATDNCSTVTLTQSPVAGTPLPLGANTITITATDACGNSSACTFVVTVIKTLDVTVTNSNPQLYYGYSLDQSTVIKGTPTGGVGPYKVVITMNRVLGCNAVTSTGDEVWTAAGGTSVGNTCPTAGTAASIPVSTAINVAAGGSYSVTATLMANAVFTVTITDANGCTVSKTTTVNSEDARCFTGSAGNNKIKLCHRTGNPNDPCHELCVAESAVQAHLAHGDFLGSCTPGCIAPAAPVSRAMIAPISAPVLEVNVMPNPTPTYFNVVIKGADASPVTVRVIDAYGRQIHLDQKIGAFTTLRLGDKWPSGTYMVEVIQGMDRKVIKVIKAK